MTVPTNDDPSYRKLHRQLDVWREALVGLDRRQRLIYFKHTTSGSLEISTPSMEDILPRVEKGCVVGVDLDPAARQTLEPELRYLADAPVRASHKTPQKLRTSLTRLYQQSNQTWADRGYWTLYLGLGCLSWRDPADNRSVESPLLLCPVELSREGTQAPYVLTRHEDDIVVNPALRVKLEREFDVRLPAIDSDVVDPMAYVAKVAEATADQDGWEVRPRIVLTLFSFHKEAIFRDLSDHEDQVLAHDLVQRIALGTDSPHSETVALDWDARVVDLDTVAPPERMRTILDADSSQRACIAAARDGKSFVMDGPPGTGKSQTIANMIAELIAQGRSVLFVSEKAAALDVVHNRLAEAGLGDFLLELHSQHATRKEVVGQLAKALRQRWKPRKETSDADRIALQGLRQNLSAFAAAMNETRAGIDRSVMDVLGDLMGVLLDEPVAVVDPHRWKNLTVAREQGLQAKVEQLARAWRPVAEGDDFVWREASTPLPAGMSADQLEKEARRASEAAAALLARGSAVEEDLAVRFGRSVSAQQQRHELLLTLHTQPEHPDHWLTASSIGPVEQRLADLRRVIEQCLQGEARATAQWGDQWVTVDPEALSIVRDLADRPADHRHSVWDGGPDARVSTVRTAVDGLRHAIVDLVPVVDKARQLAAILGISADHLTLSRVNEIIELARLGGSAAQPERAWLNPALQKALDESARVLGEVVAVVRERRTRMAEVFTAEALDLDLQAINTRFSMDHKGLRRWSSQAREDRKTLRAVTVRRRVDKGVLAALDEAVAWQQAEQRLETTENTYAGNLGRYYQRTDTDFSRLATAIDVAHSAVRLAGADLSADQLASQLCLDASQDPRLLVLVDQLDPIVRRWQDDLRAALRPEVVDAVEEWPVAALAQWAEDVVADLSPKLEALSSTAEAIGRDLTATEGADLLQTVLELTESRGDVLDAYDHDVATFGDAYAAFDTDWEGLTRAVTWAARVRELAGGAVSAAAAQCMRRPTISSVEVADLIESWATSRDALVSVFTPTRGSELRADLDSDLRDAVEILAEMSDRAVADLDEWERFVTISKDLRAVGLDRVLEALMARRVGADEVAPRARWAILQAWVEATISSDPRLRDFRAADRDALVELFRQSDDEHVRLAHAEVARICSEARPRNTQSHGAQVIMRQAELKSRHKPVRTVLAEAQEIVQLLKPCFMMSPLTVSQFLPGDMRFDVVIFDEASQVLPSDAVNCIYRGRQLIVAGDDKQLPPTSFFQAAVDSEDGDDEEPDEFESILSVCKAGVLPQLPLSWHYRSRHEHLIAYSNYRFYAPDDQPLQSFPGAKFDAPDLGVELVAVNGVYGRGGSGDNPIEAGAVVDRIAHHRHCHPDMTIGVVTFSSKQADAVFAAVERRAQDDPLIASMLDEHDRLDGFFVKSIENVQGDERDLIIFSVGYGPDESGKITTNFGALNQKSGWRRLNVAITRARRRVEVVSSLRAGDIPPSSNPNVEHLRAYLAFAERGISALALDIDSSAGDTESPFEEDVLKVLTSWGYEVVPQVGVAGYRVDLGVRHPDRPGEYLLGVECDGAAYHSARTARDRDRLRASVLEGLGWRLHRVWGLSWYRDRRTQMERLRSALDAARAGEEARGSSAAHTVRRAVELESEDFDPEAPPEWAVPYKVYRRRVLMVEEPRSVEARPHLRAYITDLVKAEAPIHEDVILKRIRTACDIGRIGSAIRENVDRVMRQIRVDGRELRRDGQGFFHIDGQGPIKVRVPQDEAAIRSVGEIASDELTQAVIYLIGDSVTISEDALVGAVMTLFGWRRRGNDIVSGVRRAIERAVTDGYVTTNARGQLTLAAA